MPHHTVTEPHEEGFNLPVWWEGLCTSVGCIGGCALQLMQQDGILMGNRTAEQAAMHYLGLHHNQASALFYPGEEELPLHYSDVDADHAASVQLTCFAPRFVARQLSLVRVQQIV